MLAVLTLHPIFLSSLSVVHSRVLKASLHIFSIYLHLFGTSLSALVSKHRLLKWLSYSFRPLPESGLDASTKGAAAKIS